MTDIFVSDLFGYNITGDSPFVVINSKELYKLLKKVAENQKYIIWEYNKNKINEILKLRNVDPSRFLSSGNILYDKNKKNELTTLILVNKSISRSPNFFTKVSDFGSGQIVDAVYKINDAESHSLGLYYVKNGDQLNKNDIAVIPNDMTKVKFQQEKDSFTTNDFSLLSSNDEKIGIRTIDRSKLFTDDAKDMKLTSSDGKYLTMVEDSNTDKKIAKIKSKQSSERQKLSYNVQGELIVNGKCLTYQNQESPVYFDECKENDKNQKWVMEKGKIVPQNDYDKCLTAEKSDGIYLKDCNNTDEQSWNTEESDANTSSDYGWKKYKGKTVVLVASDNPWYINEDVTEPMKYVNKENISDDVKYRNNADYKTLITLDPSKADLGLGHSYLERANNGCNEGFGNSATGDDKYIIMLLFFVIFFVLAYKWIR